MINKKHISLIDMDIMRDVFGNDIAILEYLKRFIKITSALLKNIGLSIQEKNKPLTLTYFHQLKGSVGTIGFKKMYALCEKAEEKITQADWVSAYQAHQDMEQILKNLNIELQKSVKVRN